MTKYQTRKIIKNMRRKTKLKSYGESTQLGK